ncbi:MAG: hypothetical protein LBK01_03645 [Burkholderiaceae bacterium]|jgi:hypothetical protein|nr:hypothetical protein [Burkholderiaceae bacterium]
MVAAMLAGTAFVGGMLAGHITLPADATDNTVNVVASPDFDSNQIVAGGLFVNGAVVYVPLSMPGDPNSVSLQGNTLTLRDGEIAGKPGGNIYVVGGVDWDLAGTGEVSGNAVNVAGGAHGRKGLVVLFGGMSRGIGLVTGNTVTVTDGVINGIISGGQSLHGHVSGNTVTITGGSGSDVIVSGGVSAKGDAVGNTVTVAGGHIGEEIYGGTSAEGSADQNIVAVTSGRVNMAVYGGASVSGGANGNTLLFKNTVVGADIIGGWSATSATGNAVTLSGQTLFERKTDVLGGAGGGTVSGNTLTFDDFRQAGEGGIKDVRGFDQFTFIGIKAGQRHRY